MYLHYPPSATCAPTAPATRLTPLFYVPMCRLDMSNTELAVDHMAYGSPRCMLSARLHSAPVDAARQCERAAGEAAARAVARSKRAMRREA
eukprot:5740336-Pyramimonas_sp.AAC.1